MDWSRAKTIFIIIFLLLNTFLFIQLREMKHANQLNVISEATLQERLEEMNITIGVEIEDEPIGGYYIVGKNKEFAANILETLTEQEVTLLNETTIFSVLEDPYELKEEEWLPPLTQYLSTTIYGGEHYQFIRFDEERNELLFMKKYDEKVMYSFNEAPLVLKLDGNDVVAYQQTILEVDEQGREQEFLSGYKAIEKLLNEQIIKANNTITEVDLGYYSFFNPVGDVQVFAPMWRIIVDEKSYLVNAIDGSLQDFN